MTPSCFRNRDSSMSARQSRSTLPCRSSGSPRTLTADVQDASSFAVSGHSFARTSTGSCHSERMRPGALTTWRGSSTRPSGAERNQSPSCGAIQASSPAFHSDSTTRIRCGPRLRRPVRRFGCRSCQRAPSHALTTTSSSVASASSDPAERLPSSPLHAQPATVIVQTARSVARRVRECFESVLIFESARRGTRSIHSRPSSTLESPSSPPSDASGAAPQRSS